MFLYTSLRDWRDGWQLRALLDKVGDGLLSTITPKVSFPVLSRMTHSPFTRVVSITLTWGDPIRRTGPILRWGQVEAVVGASDPIFVEMGPVKVISLYVLVYMCEVLPNKMLLMKNADNFEPFVCLDKRAKYKICSKCN